MPDSRILQAFRVCTSSLDRDSEGSLSLETSPYLPCGSNWGSGAEFNVLPSSVAGLRGRWRREEGGGRREEGGEACCII